MYQERAFGYGHALFCANEFVNNESFLHLVRDHLYINRSDVSCAKHLVEFARNQKCAVSAVQATRETLIPDFRVAGGTGFIFHRDFKQKGRKKLQEIMAETKCILEHTVLFAMEPVVYDFKINENGTVSKLLEGSEAILPVDYYTFITPSLLKRELSSLTNVQRSELETVGRVSRCKQGYESFVSGLFENMLPDAGTEQNQGVSLKQLLEKTASIPNFISKLNLI